MEDYSWTEVEDVVRFDGSDYSHMYQEKPLIPMVKNTINWLLPIVLVP